MRKIRAARRLSKTAMKTAMFGGAQAEKNLRDDALAFYDASENAPETKARSESEAWESLLNAARNREPFSIRTRASLEKAAVVFGEIVRRNEQ